MRRLLPVAFFLAILPGCGPSESAVTSEIAGHKFWRTPVGPEFVERVVQTVQAMKQDEILLIDESGKLSRVGGAFASGQRSNMKVIGPGRNVVLDMAAYPSAPSRSEILRRFKEEVDRADFRSAPEPVPAIFGGD